MSLSVIFRILVLKSLLPASDEETSLTMFSDFWKASAVLSFSRIVLASSIIVSSSFLISWISPLTLVASCAARAAFSVKPRTLLEASL